MAAYLEHVGIRVTELTRYLSLFETVFEMPVERVRTNPDGSREAWLQGGLQLCEIPGSDDNNGRLHHLCLIVDDLEGSREKAIAWGCRELPKHHWVQTPDGLQIEMFRAFPGAIETLKGLKKR